MSGICKISGPLLLELHNAESLIFICNKSRPDQQCNSNTGVLVKPLLAFRCKEIIVIGNIASEKQQHSLAILTTCIQLSSIQGSKCHSKLLPHDKIAFRGVAKINVRVCIIFCAAGTRHLTAWFAYTVTCQLMSHV